VTARYDLGNGAAKQVHQTRAPRMVRLMH